MKLPINEIHVNEDNPRYIRDDKFEKLVKSIKDFPEMLDVREVVINKEHVILGGNMRYKAAVEAGLKEIPVKIVDWSEEKQKEFIIKDNTSGGEWDWDILANQYDPLELEEYGLDIPNYLNEDFDNAGDEITDTSEYSVKVTFLNKTNCERFVDEIKAIAEEYEGNVSVNSA